MVSVLFAAKDSVYKTIPGLDVWDEERDALRWPGGNRGIFHPPCRLFCMLSRFSTAPVEEKGFAYWSIEQVRKHGGILEHPAYSKLWKEKDLPRPGRKDKWGFCTGVEQWWWGHPARKWTWLYCCGIKPGDLPVIPLRLGRAFDSLGINRRLGSMSVMSNKKSLRSHTPKAFAEWLVKACE